MPTDDYLRFVLDFQEKGVTHLDENPQDNNFKTMYTHIGRVPKPILPWRK